MNATEAKEWLEGNRSTCNHFYETASSTENAEVLTAQADAARTQQAYWVIKAYKELK